MTRVGLFGGTFDPPHIGHLVVAAHTRHALDLDEMHFVVANDPWQKSGGRDVTAAHHRLEMVRLATRDHPGLVVSTAEIDRGGPSYTIDTVLETLRNGASEVVVVVGRDAAAGLDTWHRAGELRELAAVAIVDRPGSTAEPPPGWRTRYVDAPQVDVSSTELRARLVRGEPVDVLVPRPVIDYIERQELYPPPK